MKNELEKALIAYGKLCDQETARQADDIGIPRIHTAFVIVICLMMQVQPKLGLWGLVGWMIAAGHHYAENMWRKAVIAESRAVRRAEIGFRTALALTNNDLEEGVIESSGIRELRRMGTRVEEKLDSAGGTAAHALLGEAIHSTIKLIEKRKKKAQDRTPDAGELIRETWEATEAARNRPLPGAVPGAVHGP